LGREGSQIWESQKTCRNENASGLEHKIMKDLLQRFSFVRFFIAGLLIACSAMHSCNTLNENHQHQSVKSPDNIQVSSVEYALGFDLVQKEDFQLLHIFRHYNDNSDTLSYVLFKENASIPERFSDFRKIQVPVERIALLNSSYLSYFNFCQAKDHIKAISEARYIYDDEVYGDVQEGRIKEIGFGETIDKEQLLALDIDLVVNVGWPNTPDKNEQLLLELGIEQLILSEWQESTLLGRSEWVKVIAVLTGKEDSVNFRFSELAVTYDSLENLSSKVTNRPTVLCNLPYKGSWYVPGGGSYVSKLIESSGANYLWSDEEGTGGMQLDFESVYARGLNADFWINPGTAHTIKEVIDSDIRLTDFQPVETGNVYNSNQRKSREEANDYWESGLMNPHIILADMIHILHPELLPDHQLIYHKKMK